MARVAVIVDELYEDSELNQPVAAFKKAGHSLVLVGMEKGRTVTGKNEGTTAVIELAVAEADPAAFDALLIPGGYSPDKLRRHDEAVEFTRAMFSAGKPAFIICHAVQLLVTARVLKGYTSTGHKAVWVDIENAGAKLVDREVAVDRNLVSSRTPADLPAFIKACLEMLEKA